MKNIKTGDLKAEPGVVYEYAEITGYINARGADTKTAFPKLTSVGGSIDANGADTKTAFPKLTSVGGYIDARDADTKTFFPKLTSVGGSIYANGADTKTAFPKLTSVGGYIDASGADTSRVKTNDPTAIQNCRTALIYAFASVGFSFADNILARIVYQRGNVSRIVICGKTQVSYLVTDGSSFSHGSTLKEARDGLIYKIGSRDKSKYKTWLLDRVVTKKEAIEAYRVITGACEGGVRSWMDQRETPDTITVQGIIDITKGAYGSDQFESFFERAAEEK